MKRIFTLLLIVLSIFITSCSSNDDSPLISPYAGYYRIVQAESDVPVDLDDDGMANTDLMAEIEDFHHMPGDIFLEERTNGYKSMNFHIPHPNIPDDMESFHVGYAHAAFGVRYEYSYATNKIILDNSVDLEYYRQWGLVQSVEILDGTTLKCILKKDYYDYQVHAMKNLTLTLILARNN